MAKIIASLNQKGGVGKTAVAINLGAGLVRANKKVLLLDFDPQGSLTSYLGFPEPDEMNKTVAEVLTAAINDEPMDAGYGIIHHLEGMDVLPANIKLSSLEMTLVNVMCRELVLKKYLATIQDSYDYIIIDCMASLGLLTINVLAASDSVLIPIKAEEPSLLGLQQLLRTIGLIRKNINPNLAIEGIVPNMMDNRTNYSKGALKKLQEAYGDVLKIYEPIPQSVRMAETASEGVSIYMHAKSAKATQACEELVKGVLANE